MDEAVQRIIFENMVIEHPEPPQDPPRDAAELLAVKLKFIDENNKKVKANIVFSARRTLNELRSKHNAAKDSGEQGSRAEVESAAHTRFLSLLDAPYEGDDDPYQRSVPLSELLSLAGSSRSSLDAPSASDSLIDTMRLYTQALETCNERTRQRKKHFQDEFDAMQQQHLTTDPAVKACGATHDGFTQPPTKNASPEDPRTRR